MKTGITTIAGIFGLALLKRFGSRAVTEVETKSARVTEFQFDLYICCNEVYMTDVENKLKNALKSMIGDVFLDYTIREEGHEFIIKSVSVDYSHPPPDVEEGCYDLHICFRAISDLDTPNARWDSYDGDYVGEEIKEVACEIFYETFNSDHNVYYVEDPGNEVLWHCTGDVLIPLIQQRKRSRPSSSSRLRTT